MIYTLKINTTSVDNLKKHIEKYSIANNLSLSQKTIDGLAYIIHDTSYMYVDEVQASSEDSAFEKFDETRLLEEVEITDIDDRDEMEAEERARAKYESQLEDEATERYYESKYGDKEK